MGTSLLPLLLLVAPAIHAATVNQGVITDYSLGYDQGKVSAGVKWDYTSELEVCSEGDDVGVCVPASQCEPYSSNRMRIGICDADKDKGAEVCCKQKHTCGDAIKSVISHFTNPLFPAPERDDLGCNVKIHVRRKVCQLRLDFVEFRLPAPSGNCLPQNNMKILAPSMPLGILGGKKGNPLCGLNKDQHLYIPVTAGDTVQIVTTLSGTSAIPISRTNIGLASDTEYKWNIRITQIECNSDHPYFSALEAPRGCTQWFTDAFGSFKSFNFDGNSDFAPDQDYGICIRNEGNAGARSCSVTLRAQQFKMPPGGIDRVPCASGTDIVNVAANRECCLDPLSAYLAFVGKQPRANTLTTRRYWCGEALGSTTNQVATSAKPYVLKVYSPKVDKWDITKPPFSPIGFSIDYKVDTGLC